MTTDRIVFIEGNIIDLVVLEKDDAKINVHWINDFEVTQFLGRGKVPHTVTDQESFIERSGTNAHQVVLGIYHRKDQCLIGSTGLHDIDTNSHNAEFGIMIGNKNYWGKGIGTEVLTLMCAYGFTHLNLRNISLAVLSGNHGGQKCYKRCGFVEVGRMPNFTFSQGVWYDHIFMLKARI